MNNKELEFDWLEKLLAAIPDGSPRMRSLLEIASVSNRERVNSDLMGFYLNENEEHGLGRAFLDALMALVFPNQLFPTFEIDNKFEVALEVETKKGNYIDIVVTSKTVVENQPAWAIVIENKVWSKIQNDLRDYSDSVVAIKKALILLSVNPVSLVDQRDKLRPNNFVNVLHKDLAAKVKSMLGDFWSSIPERHLVFLQDYFRYIDSLYPDSQYITRMEKTLHEFQAHHEEIAALAKLDTQLQKYIVSEVILAMANFDYSTPTEYLAQGKLFYSTNALSSEAQHFRFYVRLDHIRSEPAFRGIFELHGKESTIFGSKLRERLREEKIHGSDVKEADRGSDGGTYNQIYWIYFPLKVGADSTLSQTIIQELGTRFFNNSNRYVQRAIEIFNELRTEQTAK